MSESKSTPLISIVTVVYNDAKGLEKTIQSVINQPLKIYEYIIIDGGSNDGTLKIIKKYKNYIKYWISEPDQGIYDAMNKGIDVANGNYIHFLNAGDIYYKTEMLNKQLKSLKKNKYSLIIGNSIHIDEQRNIEYINYNHIKSFNKFYIKNKMVCHQAVLFKKEIFNSIGKYSLRYNLVSDQEWMLRFLSNNSEAENIHFARHPFVYYDITGISSNNRVEVYNERKRLLKKYRFDTLSFLMTSFKLKTERYKYSIILALKKIGAYEIYKKLKYSSFRYVNFYK